MGLYSPQSLERFKGFSGFNTMEELNVLCAISEFLEIIRTNFSCCINKCVNSYVKISHTK